MIEAVCAACSPPPHPLYRLCTSSTSSAPSTTFALTIHILLCSHHLPLLTLSVCRGEYFPLSRPLTTTSPPPLLHHL